MPICTPEQVKAAARIDGTEFDSQLAGYITAAQGLIEHECGVAADAFSAAPTPAVTQCAVALAAKMVENPSAGREEFEPILKSALLDGARTWS